MTQNGQPTLAPQPAGIVCANCNNMVKDTYLEKFVSSGKKSGLIMPEGSSEPIKENPIPEQPPKNVVNLFEGK